MEQERIAATIIQAHFRGYLTKKLFRERKQATIRIQSHVSRFLARRQADRDNAQQDRAARFQAVMARHQQRIQALEYAKRLLHEQPAGDHSALLLRREAAATTIQACWRGARQRRHAKLLRPTSGIFQPVLCCSPLLPDAPSELLYACSSAKAFAAGNPPHVQTNYSQNYTHHPQPEHLQQTSTNFTETGTAHAASPPTASEVALAASSSQQVAEPCAEESSWMFAEASNMSANAAVLPEPSNVCQRRSAIPAANRAMLDRQIKTRVDAVSSDTSMLKAMREKQQQTSEHLQRLLQQHHTTGGTRLQAVRRRQRLLQKADMLHQHLKQLPQIDKLTDAAWPAQYSLLRPGSNRAERAHQAHALSLGDVPTHSKWWTPLKALNQVYAARATGCKLPAFGDSSEQDVFGCIRMHHDWEYQEAAWRSCWAQIHEQELHRA